MKSKTDMVLRVALKANKNQIKQAVESLYDVKVLNVKTSVLPGKVKELEKVQRKLPVLKRLCSS